MAPMFADLLRAHPSLRRHVRSLRFLDERPREVRTEPPEVVHFSVPARGERRPHGRGAIPKDPSDPAASVPPFVCAAGPLGAGIYDEWVVRMLRDRADQPD